MENAELERELEKFYRSDRVNSDMELYRQVYADIGKRIENGDVSFGNIQNRIEQESNILGRLAMLQNAAKFQTKEAADFLLSQYNQELSKEDNDSLESQVELPCLAPEGACNGKMRYRDAIMLALIENGEASEEALLKIFDQLKREQEEYYKEREKVWPKDEPLDEWDTGDWIQTAKQTEIEKSYFQDEEGDIEDSEYATFWDEDLYRNERIIKFFGENGTKKSLDRLINFVREGGVEFYKSEIAEALSKNNPELAAQKLFGLLKDKEQWIRRDAAKLLYRLEFGKIGISEEGVKYLERMYDLGEHNNPDYFVQRLTAEGDIGVFNEKRELFKYFNLGDLSTEEKRVKAQVLDFTYDTLFSPKENETPEERTRREKILEEFQKKYFDFYNDRFFQETRVHFNNFSFREQGWYLHFVTNASDEEKQKAFDFVRQYGEDGFRTFLSLEYGDEMGDKILQIGQHLPERAAAEIFRKYGQIIDATQESENVLRASFNRERDEPLLAKTSGNLFKHGRDFLASFSDKAKTLKDAEKKTAVQQVLRQLENIKTEVLLFAAAFKTVSSEQSVKLSEVEGTSLEIKDVSALTQKEKQNMMEYYTANREGYAPDRLQATIKDFEKVLNSENKNFYLLRFRENLLAFCRIDKQPNGIYFASFNVKPDIRKYRIGTAVLGEILDKFRDHDVELDANSDLVSYYEQFGFKTVSTRSDYHGSKVYHKMVRPKKASQEAEAA